MSWDDKDFVLKAVKRHGLDLEHASDELRADKEIVQKAVQSRGRALEYASDELRADKEIAFAAVRDNGRVLEHVSNELQDNRDIVFAAVQNYGPALKFASDKQKDNRDIVFAAVQEDDRALQYASDELRADKEIVFATIQKLGYGLQYALGEARADKEVVLTAVQQNGDALKFASETLRSDKDIVIAAVKEKPIVLKFALGGLNQDPDCLKAAGLFDDSYDNLKLKNAPRIVLSTKFSLGEKTTSYATEVALIMKENPYFQSKVVYSPNSWDKNTCDPNWTDISFPCRGTKRTCLKYYFKDNLPVEKKCCWRSSYRYQLMKGKETGGFMVQVAEFDEDSQKHVLGNGQQIETELAELVGLKVFRVYQQISGYSHIRGRNGMDSDYEIADLINELVKCAESWYENGCSDLSVKEVRLEDKIW